MDKQQARELILLHSYYKPTLHMPRMQDGFLGSLRPYRGLKERNFREVMMALWVLSPELQLGEVVDRQLMDALWRLQFITYNWGLRPGNMLQRNKLITPEDTEILAEWFRAIGEAVFNLLAGVGIEGVLREHQITPAEAETYSITTEEP